jgi:hypothetical protein
VGLPEAAGRPHDGEIRRTAARPSPGSRQPVASTSAPWSPAWSGTTLGGAQRHPGIRSRALPDRGRGILSRRPSTPDRPSEPHQPAKHDRPASQEPAHLLHIDCRSRGNATPGADCLGPLTQRRHPGGPRFDETCTHSREWPHRGLLRRLLVPRCESTARALRLRTHTSGDRRRGGQEGR